MIISRTPFRVSLFGGGTDYPDWFRRHGGAVLGMAINKYCYLTVRTLPPFFEHKHRIVYSKVELVKEISEIQHPAVRGVLADMGIEAGLEIHHDADLPARSGLGSSSSFTVGLLHAIHALRGRMMTKRELCQQAIRIEQNVLNECVGCQDQIWAAYGGFNRIDFNRDGTFTVSPIVLPEERRRQVMDSMMVFFTGFSRFASNVAKEQLENIEKSANERHQVRAMVDEAINLLQSDAFAVRDLGRLLHEGWKLKKAFGGNVSTTHIDEIYETAMEAGAYGGKLLGAGGGGFMVFLVEPDRRPAVREGLRRLVNVEMDVDSDGSKIVVYEPNGLDHV